MAALAGGCDFHVTFSWLGKVCFSEPEPANPMERAYLPVKLIAHQVLSGLNHQPPDCPETGISAR